MGGLDLLIIAVVLVSVLIGCMRGFMYEAAMLFGWVLAFFVARWLAPDLSALLVKAIANENWRMGISFVLVFIAVLFTNGILAFALKALFSKPALRPMDRCLGGVFGIVRAGLVMLVMTLVVHILHLQEEEWWTQSRSAPWLNEAMEVSKPFLRSVLNLDEAEPSSITLPVLPDAEPV
ncbi:CvpA family protein [Saezia sanguinis]|uniref:CvpA family protein n=1 Tax=Saezia sanguinis TaxID=1965230 RepID=UPI003073815E